MPTLKQLYEEYDALTISYRIIIAGADISNLVDNFDYSFDEGQVPTATIQIPAQLMVSAIAEEAEVEIWVGYKIGMINLRQVVFGGGIVDSVSSRGNDIIIECVQDGARRLNYPYYREINYDFDNVLAQDSVIALLGLAGVTDYHVELDAWDIGTAVPQKLQFSNYSEAINKVSTVDGSPWFAMPSGQIRVQKSDPIPYNNPNRTYFSGVLNGIVESQPLGVVNPNARPRNLDISKNFDRAGVNNFIEVDGAVLVTIGPNGEQNSEQIKEEVDGASGIFANGAPWIPTPPLFQMFTYSNELIDTNAKANSVAERYFTLKNRLLQNLSMQVPLDPTLFLGLTARVIDPKTDTDGLYKLKAYHCTVSGNNITSDLSFVGGPYAGTQGFAKPFAEFRWTYSPMYERIGGNQEIGSTGCGANASKLNAGWQTALAAKLCQDLPQDTGSPEQGGDKAAPTAGTVMIGLDATLSQDFDGSIVSYAWSDDQGHTGSGPRVTFIYDPADGGTVQMTLTVTDDTARTDSITKSIYVSATAQTPNDPTLNDSKSGGGAAAGDCTNGGDPTHGGNGPGGANGMALVYFIAAGCKALGSKDNLLWNMIDKDDKGVGDFISVASASDYASGQVTALFGTDDGKIMKTVDGVVTGEVKHDTKNPDEQIQSIVFDPENCGNVWATTNKGQILRSTDDGDHWRPILPRDGKPVNKMLIIEDHIVLFGGDTGDIKSLIRVSEDSARTAGNSSTVKFRPVAISGALATEIAAAGAGFTIKTASINRNKLMIGFSGGVAHLGWATYNVYQPDLWVAASGLTGTHVKAIAPGHDGEFVVSTNDGQFKTNDSQNFNPACAAPQNDMSWEGLPGVYVGIEDGQLSKIVGDTCGPLFPNAGFPGQTAWPPCAVGHQVSVQVVVRGEEGGPWPAPPAPAQIWVSSGFALNTDAKIVEVRGATDPVVTPTSNCVATLAIQFDTPLTDTGDPPAREIVRVYVLRATGAAPTYSVVGGTEFASTSLRALLPLTGLVVNSFLIQDEQGYVYPSDPVHFSDSASLAANSASEALAYFNDEGGLNYISGGYTLDGGGVGGGIGPISPGNVLLDELWSADNTPFFPHVYVWTWMTGIMVRALG